MADLTQDTSSVIIKRGEQYGAFTLHRSPAGLTMSIHVHPIVEEFVQGLTGTEATQVDVKTLGRYWRPLREDIPLMVWRTEKLPHSEYEEDSTRFTLDKPGDPLLADYADPLTGRTAKMVNLSFLRLVGISEARGVTFSIKGVYSYEVLKEMDRNLTAALRKFYNRYLKPIDLSIMVHTQEL